MLHLKNKSLLEKSFCKYLLDDESQSDAMNGSPADEITSVVN
jgi:hypothetical protein